VLGIIAMIESKQLELLSSEVLSFEIRRNTNLSRRDFALEILANASKIVQVEAPIQNRAQQLAARRVMALDALHLAAAEAGKADYFCTCDDKLLKKARRLCAATLKVVSPIELLEELQ
jgi:predicted nucleic acid-binding protein